jgi:hypothetical protein
MTTLKCAGCGKTFSSSAKFASDVPTPRHASGSRFYRYSEFSEEKREWLKEIILDHRLYVPTVSQLNDPADGRPQLALLSDDQMFHFLYDGPFGVLQRNPRMSVEQQIREGVILDSNIRNHRAEVLLPQLQMLMNRHFERYRVYSLSKRYDNLSLWAKYAGNHSGYCLEFNDEGPLFGSAREVTYYDELTQVDVTNREALNGWWLFSKTREWSGEEEVRILGSPDAPSKVVIDPHWLSRIILGWKMPEQQRAQIREWASERNPRLTVVSAQYDAIDHMLKLSV